MQQSLYEEVSVAATIIETPALVLEPVLACITSITAFRPALSVARHERRPRHPGLFL